MLRQKLMIRKKIACEWYLSSTQGPFLWRFHSVMFTLRRFFQAFWLNAKKFQPIKILKKKAMRKTYAIIIFAGLVLGRSNTVVSN